MSKYGSEKFNRIVAALKALSNEHRLELFRRMSCCCRSNYTAEDDESGECVTDLGRGLDIAPSTLSHHLRELYIAGLVQKSRKGKEIYCCIDEEALEDITTFFNELKQLKGCGE